MKAKRVDWKIKYIFAAGLLLILVMFLTGQNYPVQAASGASVKDANITYNSVEKDIIVDKNKVCHITEKITVTYERDGVNIGLSRNISKVNTITRVVDGKEYKKTYINTLNLLSVTMDGVDEFHFLEESGDYYYINIGADGDYKAGQHTYEIVYTYDMGEDFISDFDDFTFDIMDYGFASRVENFSATITLPSSFYESSEQLAEMLSFRTNDFEAVDASALNMSVEGQTIRVNYQNLSAENGFTLQLILPNGYFSTTYSPNGVYIATTVIAVLVLVAVCFLLLYHKFQKHPLQTVEFYPPENFSTLDVARSYRAKLRSKDFSALIIEWASQKLVSIQVTGKSSLTLTKLADYPSESANESRRKECQLFNSLFLKGDVVSGDKKAFKKLPIFKAVKELYSRPKAAKEKAFWLKFATCVLSVLPMLLFIVWSTVMLNDNFPMLFLILFPILGVLIFTYTDMPMPLKIVWCLLFGGLPLICMNMFFYWVYDIYFLLPITSVIMVLGICLSGLIKVFSEEELQARGKVLGFKKFLKFAELSRLEMLVSQDPEYYYNILPFCYVFDLTDKIEEKFKALNFDKPAYCNGFSVATLGGCISRSLGRAGLSSPSSRGGVRRAGGGGRRGSSGGGGGGGGSRGR